QVIPHITDEIKRRMKVLGESGKYDIVITEIGGTVGDIESLPFIEAMRQIMLEMGRKNALNIHVTLVPYIVSAGEMKTKPTQHSVKNLLELGIQPNILVCRSENKLSKDIREKIALFTNVKKEAVISAHDCSTIYEVPIVLYEQNLDRIVLERLKLPELTIKLEDWQNFVNSALNPVNKVKIAICGKYIENKDAYKSISEAFVHAGAENNSRVKVDFISSEVIEDKGAENVLKNYDGILIPGGFGERGIEGKILAIQYARENKIPFLGICLGMQCAVIEFARNVCGIKKANSEEFVKNTNSVIHIMPEQKKIKTKGATMRLGAYPCVLKKGTKSFEAYRKPKISERHRHRFEVNNKYRSIIEEKGLIISGTSPDEYLVEMVELNDHPWFVGCQFHPELKSRATKAHPLFREFVKASLEYTQRKNQN
ncbi:MAG: CTP synthase, partial [Melioribacteraceae bacterium]